MADEENSEKPEGFVRKWNFKIPDPEPDVRIKTPNGEYVTSQSKAEGLKAFIAECYDPERQGVCGGQFNYIFTDTSIGTLLTVEDVLSKKTFDVTDPWSL